MERVKADKRDLASDPDIGEGAMGMLRSILQWLEEDPSLTREALIPLLRKRLAEVSPGTSAPKLEAQGD